MHVSSCVVLNSQPAAYIQKLFVFHWLDFRTVELFTEAALRVLLVNEVID